MATLLSEPKRAAFTLFIVEAMKSRRMSSERLADAATDALSKVGAGPPPPGATDEEIELWRDMTVTAHEINKLRRFPARPMATPRSRAVLLGVTIALGLDRAQVNRLAGGI
jgi:hypothetical protein